MTASGRERRHAEHPPSGTRAPGKLPERWMAYRVEHHDQAFFPQFRAVSW
jgi:hypothetical protein